MSPAKAPASMHDATAARIAADRSAGFTQGIVVGTYSSVSRSVGLAEDLVAAYLHIAVEVLDLLRHAVDSRVQAVDPGVERIADAADLSPYAAYLSAQHADEHARHQAHHREHRGAEHGDENPY